MVNAVCNICSGNQVELIYDVSDFWLKNFSKQYQYYQCQTCGVIFRNSKPSEIDFNFIYPPNYEVYTQHNTRDKVNQFLIDFGLLKRYKVFSKYIDKGTILDIGCADGAFLSYLKKYNGWKLYGVEKNDEIPKSRYSLNGVNIFYGDLKQANYNNMQFDIVTMWDVIEHIEDPIGILCEINRILKKDGFLIIKVPNGRCLDVKIFKKYWAGIDAPRHIYIFNKENLGCLLQNSGYEIKKAITQFGGYLNFLKSLQFLLSEKKIFNEQKLDSLIRLLKNPFFRVLSFPIFKIINLLGYGSSLVIVARKN